MGVLNDRDPALFFDELRVQKELQLRLVLELRRLVHDFDEIGVNFWKNAKNFFSFGSVEHLVWMDLNIDFEKATSNHLSIQYDLEHRLKGHKYVLILLKDTFI